MAVGNNSAAVVRSARYAVIVMDSPWPENGAGKIPRGANRHYKTMKIKDIEALKVGEQAAEDCHLWMWATDTYEEDALRIIRRYGFRKVATWIWVKTTKDGQHIKEGIGQYSRKSHELLFLCTRGKAAVPATKDRPTSVILAPPTEHSEKPQEAWDVIERVSRRRGGPRLELFARTRRSGWLNVGAALGQPDLAQWLEDRSEAFHK